MTQNFDTGLYLEYLTTEKLGRRPETMAETDSTNTWVAQRLDQPDINRVVAIAERQTAGRGRYGRVWHSPPYVNLAVSVAWMLPDGDVDPQRVTTCAGAALHKAIAQVANIHTFIKYPNDLLYNGKKLAGILTEIMSGGGRKYAVIGAGVNVNTDEAMLPEDLRDKTTSLKIISGKKICRERILAVYLNMLEPELSRIGGEMFYT